MAFLDWYARWVGRQAAKAVRRERPTIIAVTGSVGKSSTRQAIASMLNADEPGSRTRVSRKNFNNELGVPLTIFGLDAPGRSLWKWVRAFSVPWLVANGFGTTGARTFVLEMGADRPGDLAKLVAIAPPDIAVVTAVTPVDPSIAPVHTANYPSIDAVAEEKATLVKAVRSGGTVILNADDSRVFAMRHLTHEHVLTFGEADGADVRLVEARVRCEEGTHGVVPLGLVIRLESLNRLREFYVPGVFGRSVAFAVSAAAATGVALDIGQEAVLSLSKHFTPLPGRTRIIPGIKFTTLLDDSYNSSPAAALSALRDLADLPLREDQRRVACLGEMRELGDASESLHRMVGHEAAKLGIDLLVCAGPFARAMAEGAFAGGMTDERVKVFDDTPEAGLFLQQWIKPGDVILAKASEGTIASKGVRMERVIKELMAEPLRAKELLCRQEEAWKRR